MSTRRIAILLACLFTTAAASDAATLTISSTDSPDPVRILNSVTYTITVTNSGPDTALSPAASVDVPVELFINSAIATNGFTCLSAAQNATCSAPSLAAAQSTTITLDVVSTSIGIHPVTTTASAANAAPVMDIEGTTFFNDAPLTTADSYTTAEDAPLTIAAPGVLGNDTDPESDPMTAIVVTNGSKGSVALASDGSFTYTPNANANGTDTFTYRASDPTIESAVTTVTINITPVNDAPLGNVDVYNGTEDTPMTIAAPGVLANDTDPDGDALTAVLVSPPAQGTLSLDPNGGFTFTPAPNANIVASFSYRATDGTAHSSTQTVIVNLASVNDPPVAVNDSYDVPFGGSLTVAAPALLGNDTDVDGNTLTAALASPPSQGTVVIASDGGFTYTANPGATGTDTFTYRAFDTVVFSAPATVTITFTASGNRPPVAVPDSLEIREDAPIVTLDVLANDSDPDGDPLSIDEFGSSDGPLRLQTDGRLLKFRAPVNYAGTAKLWYTATDGLLVSAPAPVMVTVLPVNDPPSAQVDQVAVIRNQSLTFNVLKNDVDVDGDAMSLGAYNQPEHGNVKCAENGDCTYAPSPDFLGEDDFTYLLKDPTGEISIGTVAIEVRCPNLPPKLLFPSSEAALPASKVRFVWEAAPHGASGYRVWYQPEGTPFPVLLGSTTSTSFAPAATIPEGDHLWWVEAQFGSCASVESLRRRLRVLGPTDSTCALGDPQLLTPVPDAVLIASPLFRWTPVTGVSRYRLWARIDGGAPRVLVETANPFATLAGIQGTHLLWYVDAVSSSCTARSAARTLTLRTGACSTEAPELLSPKDGDHIQIGDKAEVAVDFRVRVPAGAAEIRLLTRLGGGIAYALGTYPHPASGDTLVISRSVTPGVRETWAEAVYPNGCVSEKSASAMWTLTGRAAGRGYLHAPPSEYRGPSPVLVDWVGETGALSTVTIYTGDQRQVMTLASPGPADLPPGRYSAWLSVKHEGWTSLSQRDFTINEPAAEIPMKPDVKIAARAASEKAYKLSFLARGATRYEIEEWTAEDAVTRTFSNLTTATLSHKGQEKKLTYVRYRVRGINDVLNVPGDWSDVVTIEIGPVTLHGESTLRTVGGRRLYLFGEQDPYDLSLAWEQNHPDYVLHRFVLFPPKELWDLPFQFEQSRSRIVLPEKGLITNPLVIAIGVRRDQEAGPEIRQFTFLFNYSQNDLKVLLDDDAQSPILAIPVRLGLAPAVETASTGEPPSNAVLLPVAYLTAGSTRWSSNVHLTNPAPLDVEYRITYRAATGEALSALVPIPAGLSIPIADIVDSYFGQRSAGVLEIHPENLDQPVQPLVASRLRRQEGAASVGQFVPAIPYSEFIGAGDEFGPGGRLLLSPVVQNDTTRSNLGLIEGSGHAATVEVTIFGSDGKKSATFVETLGAFESRQLNALLSARGVTQDNGYASLRVIAGSGRVTGYVSLVDAGTGDAELVPPVSYAPGAMHSAIAGVGQLESVWRSDLTLTNAGPEALAVTLRYRNASRVVNVAGGSSETLRDVAGTLFAMPKSVGVLHVETPAPSPLLSSVRTYRPVDSGGTVGQMIRAVPVESARGRRDGSFLVPIERSLFTRTNLGVAEVKGGSVTVEITAMEGARELDPITVSLAGGEVRQWNDLAALLGVDEGILAVRVRVVAGEGGVIAYASHVDEATGDPTYTPAQ
jgi:VCBS repeat-containing protein